MLNLKTTSQLLGIHKHLCVIITDTTGKYVFANDCFHELSGYTMEELERKDMQLLLHPDDKRTWEKMRWQCLNDPGQSFSADIRQLTKHGNISRSQWDFKCLVNEQAAPTGIICIGSGVTKLDKHQEIVDSITDGFLTLDEQWTITSWNKAAEKMTGLDKTAVIGNNYWEIFEYKKDQSLYKEFHRAITEKETISFEEFDGSFQKWYQVTAYPFSRGLTTIFRDITEKKKLETKAGLVRLAKQRLLDDATLHAKELQREEIARELHDNVNQLLATAALLTEAAITGTVAKEELLPRVAILIKKAISEIRTLSKSVLTSSLDNKTLLQALLELQTNINESGLMDFILETGAFREPVDDPDIKLALYRIIQELLTNTVKHARASWLSIQLSSEDGIVKLLAKDNGVGFDPSKKAEGIGLRNIRYRLSLLGGSMDIHSLPGHGTSFSIMLRTDSSSDIPAR